MTRALQGIVLVGCSVALAVAGAHSAHADGKGLGSSDGDKATVTANNGNTQSGTPPSNGGAKTASSGGGGATMCTAQDGTYGPITAKPLAQWGPFANLPGAPPSQDQQQYYVIYCGGHFLHLELLTLSQAAAISAPGPGIDPAVVAQQAEDQIRPPTPTIHMNPDSSRDQLVGLPTWLWVEQGDVGTLSKTVYAGPVTVTGTLTATSVTWNMGDHHSFACDGPGTPYADGAKPTCSYTYAKSSATQQTEIYTVTATITWSGKYTVTGAPGGGGLTPITRTSSATVRVAEAQAINTPS